MKHEGLAYKRQFLLMNLRPSMISISLLIMTGSWANMVLGAGCPERCSCSTSDGYTHSRDVKCSFLDLSGIPEILHAATVHNLDLSNNEISILKDASFSSFSELLTLILSNNEVEEIEKHAFAGLGMTMDIDLSYNNLESFNPEIFSSNPVLENVSLKGNPIAFLSSSSPILISESVKSLDISSCSVTTIHPVTFSRLPKLYFLDLSSNLLQTISLSSFQNLPDLTILELNNNRWTCNCDVVEVMLWAESRREQQRAHKAVKCLEGRKYRTLWTVAGGSRSCSQSKTTELPSAVGDDGAAECPGGCNCSTVNGFVNSTAVQCSYLGLSDIPAMLSSGTLHILDLSKNEITILQNASFSNYSRLSTLILSYNKVEEIEINAFAGLQMMRDIDLSYNNLKSFNPTIFSSNPVLEKVNLRENSLVFLSSELPILISTSISALYLSSCSLTTINPVTFSRLPSLYDLDLSSNKLQTISLRTLEKVPELKILELSNNPWSCNCDIADVIQWAESRREQQPALKPIKCLEGQYYRTLWTMAGGNRSCIEYKTTESAAVRDRKFTTDMTVYLPITSNGIAPPLKSSPGTILQQVIETAVTSEAEHGPAPESETLGSASLLSWNGNTMTVFVILPITLGVAVFVSLIAVHYVTKRCRIQHPQHHNQGNGNHVAAFFSAVSFLKTQPTTKLVKSLAGYENRNSDCYNGAVYHVYERID